MIIPKTAVRDGKVMQDFDSESLSPGIDIPQVLKAIPGKGDCGTKDGFNLPSSTAGFRIIERKDMLWNSDLSLFSPQVIGERHHRGLLIQFLLSEIIEAHKAIENGNWEALVTPHPRFFPYDWGKMTGYLNKIQEHSLLLCKSFPDRAKAVKSFQKTLLKQLYSLFNTKKHSMGKFQGALQRIYAELEPLIESCRENENLLLFLLKNRQEIDALTEKGHLHDFLLQIHPCGLETLGEKMCDQYHQRGFFSQISEFKLLLTELSHA